MTIEDGFNILRLAIHVMTVVILSRYHDPGARFRPVISTVASAITGASLGLACHTALAMAGAVPPGPAWSQSVLFISSMVLLALILRSHGNIAHMLRMQR